MSEKLYTPDGDWLVTLGDMSYEDGKAPTQAFNGWPSGEPSSKNADWNHEGTWNLADHNLNDVQNRLKETDKTAFLLDIDGANLLILDYDYEPEGGSIEEGKWPDRDELVEYVTDTFDGQTIWESQNSGLQVPVLLTDAAFEEIWNNEWKAGYGVDALKGPAAKGYTAAPLSPGYGVHQTGGMPKWDVDDLEDFDGIELSDASPSVKSTNPEDFEPVIDREAAHQLDETTDIDELFAAINQLRPGDFCLSSTEKGDRGDGTVLFDPAWRHSSTGESLMWLPDEGVFWDAKHRKGMFADKLVALEEGIINDVHDSLEGENWSEAVDKLRGRGAPIPVLEEDPFDGTKTPTLTQRKRSHRVTEQDRARITRIENVRDRYLLNVIDEDYEIELPMRIGKSGHSAEGACPEDQRLIVTPNKGDARDSYREHGPDNQIETIPSTDSWLNDEEQVGEVVADEFMGLISGEFQAARARAMLMQKYDLDEPDSQPYFEQYEEEPTADLILTSPGVEAVEHWNASVDTLIWDDVHPLIHYTDAFRLDDTQWESGIRGTMDKLVRDLPISQNSVESLLEGRRACEYLADGLSLVTSQNTDQDQYNLMNLATKTNFEVTKQTWKRLMLVIEVETGVDATDAEMRVTGKRHDGAYIGVRVPFFPDDLNMVIMSGDNPPLLTDWWFELCGRESPESVEFDARTLQAYWRSLNHTVIVAQMMEGTRSGGNISAKKSSRLEDFARETFDEIAPSPEVFDGEPMVLDALKSFKRRGMSKQDVRDSDNMMNFGNTRGNDAADERRLGVMHGSSHWPGFVETMTAVLDEPATIEQHGNEPAKAVDGDGDDHEDGQALLLWMKQSEPTQAAARIGSATDERSVVVCGTRHIGPQFDAYDVSEHVHLLSDAEEETLELVRQKMGTISAVAEARGVTRQAAGEQLNKLADRGLLEKEAYVGDNGEHGYEGGDIEYIFSQPSEGWKRHRAPLSGIVQTSSVGASVDDTTTQLSLGSTS